MDTSQQQLIPTPQPHQFEHRYDSLRVTIRVQIEPVPGEDDLYTITDYRRKRDTDQKWSVPVKEELGRQGTLSDLTPGPKPAVTRENSSSTEQDEVSTPDSTSTDG